MVEGYRHAILSPERRMASSSESFTPTLFRFTGKPRAVRCYPVGAVLILPVRHIAG